MTAAIDPVDLSQRLIRCESVTPAEGGALDLLQSELEAIGFKVHRLPFSEDSTPDVDNLYARYGTSAPNFCFAGHTDVVPVGAADDWTVSPFSGEVRDGVLWGRGAADMKSAIAAFASAAKGFIDASGGGFSGSISFLITGDEEGPAVNGTTKALDWMQANGEAIDVCVVGEPTNPNKMGDMIKIGRRGSMTGYLTVNGTQGHSAYPHLADNPLARMVKMLEPLANETFDEGSAHFPPSTVAITSIDTGNTANNVIPARATAMFNIRFNDLHTSAKLDTWLREMFDKVGADYELKTTCSGESFLTEPGELSEIMVASIEDELGITPELSTTGGTSDARFIQKFCQVAEFGLVGQTMHKVDERVDVADIHALARIYRGMLDRYFAAA